MENNKLIRKGFHCNERINDFIKSSANELGISESAFINICIDNYYKQQITVNTMSNLKGIIAKLEQLEKNSLNNKVK